MQATLYPLDGGRAVSIVRDVTVVGRKPGLCDVVLERGSVSKIHCLIVKTDGLLFIRDLGSTNGTKVNGQRVTRGALLPGDELAFAGAKFRVHLGPGEADAEPDESYEATEALSRPIGVPRPAAGHLSPPPAELDSIEVAEGEQLEPLASDDSQSDVRLLSEDEARE